ncbi:MAG: MarR family transcriptional regulator [Chloroflexi bacterium]|nr:MarR family transcriptional regulator [Chloroflexota bacterium]MBI1855530.1 MarR family transcriptional regulator [Chloroflexota bacterium]MBI3340609.1 MarR family transcriptional regulator [Chloroflexota bacterium]
MTKETAQIKQSFTEGLSHISHFWGFPKGVGAVFAVLYLSPAPLSLDELVTQSGLTKGAVSTNVRALARLGLVRRSAKLGDRKDYYEAETDFYKAIRSILGERQNREFDRAVRSVQETLEKLQAAKGSMQEAERKFLIERVQALQDFFDAIDALSRAVSKLDSLGISTVQNILKILK